MRALSLSWRRSSRRALIVVGVTAPTVPDAHTSGVPTSAAASPEPTGGTDRGLSRYVRRTVYPYSAHYRAVLDEVGLGARMRGRGDLGRMPPTDLREVREPGTLVLRPDLATIVRAGHRGLAARALAAKVLGGMHGFNRRVVEHHFKPVHWVVADGVPIGYAAADLKRLAARGRDWLEEAGIRRHDVLVSLVPAGATVGHWQLVLGCRRTGLSAIHLDPSTGPELVDRLAPSVLAGDPQQLVAVLAQARQSGHALANLRTILAVGDPLSGDLRAQLTSLGGGAGVVAAWAPPGVRALWSECREGVDRSDPTGYHVWSDDVLEVVGGWGGGASSGELLWTGVGWRGSAVLRLRTYTSVTVAREPCPACGRTQARIVPLAPVPRPPAREAPAPALRWEPAAGSRDGAVAAIDRPRDGPDAAVSASGLDRAAAATPAAVTGAAAVLDGEAEVAAWQVEYRVVGDRHETIVVLAPTWGAPVVPLIRRLDRHLRATQFVVLTAEEVAARVDASGGRRIVGDRAA